MRERALQHRPVDGAKDTHHGVVVFRVDLPAEQQGAQHRNERDGDDGRRRTANVFVNASG